MTGIFNIGVRALQTNQAVLQTVGNNIANVNTPGYSRQSAVQQTVLGQFTGGGYIGGGVGLATIERAHNEFLTRQSALSGSVAAGDAQRLLQLRRLEDVFQGGDKGLGAAVSDMLNAFSNVASAPTDLSARAVVLNRTDETAARFRSMAGQINDLKRGVGAELQAAVSAVNSLAERIAQVNREVAHASGSGQQPNDLLDKRDQLLKELGTYVQTSLLEDDNGVVSVFVAGSQPLLVGSTVRQFGLSADAFNDPNQTKLSSLGNGANTVLEEATLGGGKIAALLRFQNTDLAEADQLLGRMALAIGTAMNAQHRLGLDLNGNAGGDLFRLPAIPNALANQANTGNAGLQVALQTSPSSGVAALAVSNYQINFTGAAAGSITRLSDSQVSSFTSLPIQLDGLVLTASGTAQAGDSFLITPFSGIATSIAGAFSSPAALAMSSPVAARAGSSNTGTLAVDKLAARSVPVPAAITLNFTTASSYTRSDDPALLLLPPGVPANYTYTPGQAIEYATTLPATTGWSLTLKGAAKAGDTFVAGSNASVQPNADPRLNGGNAKSLLALRDAALFDGSALTDGYAEAMAQVGVMVQSASFSADVSQAIATSIEQDRSGADGVNLDEEAAKLLQYQQAYQASAKMLQIAQGVFDALMQSLGR